MTTFVGTQDNFSDAIIELIYLEYDAVEAYQTAIDRIETSEYKEKLKEFAADHQRHIRELSEIVDQKGGKAPTGPSIGKQWLTKGKVILADLIGDKTILLAMRSNEIDTNTAYERLTARKDKWSESEDILNRAYEDEKRHKAWLESILNL